MWRMTLLPEKTMDALRAASIRSTRAGGPRTGTRQPEYGTHVALALSRASRYWRGFIVAWPSL